MKQTMRSARRFPPPWTAVETDACFIVKDRKGQALAYVFSKTSRAGARRPTCSREMKRGG